jgi:hypothetical protein
MSRAMNFNAGPATLPLAALERAQSELLDFNGTGMSVMENSHRNKAYEAVHDEAIALLRGLLSIPAGYDVLFLQGGASLEFARIPMNFLSRGASADHVVTGAWSEKGLAEATAWAAVVGAGARVAASTRGPGDSYTRVARPAEAALDEKAAYVHFTSNETIHGVQYHDLPRFGPAPQVCDVSSDFLWKKIDVAPLSMLYGGAQKNIGPSGVTVVVARRDFLESGRKDLPKILQYRTHAEANSLLNTPHLRNLPGAQRPRLDPGARRPRRHRASQPREGGRAVRRGRRAPGLLPMPGRAGEPLGDERRLPPPDRGARGEVPATRLRRRDGRPEGTSQRRGYPRLDVQRRRAGVGRRPRLVHERLREVARLKRPLPGRDAAARGAPTSSCREP